MSDFTLGQKIGVINAIRKMCDKAVRNYGEICPVGGACDVIIKSIEEDLKFADMYKRHCERHEQ